MATNYANAINLQGIGTTYQKIITTLPPFLGETFFRANKVSTEQLKYYIQNQPANFLSQESSADASDVTPNNYDGFSDEIFNTKFFRTAGTISEQDLMDINNASNSNDDALLKSLIVGLYENQAQQLLQQRSRREWMAMNALVNSRIDFELSSVSYKSNPEFQVDGNDWTNEDTDIWSDLRSALDAMKKRGLRPNQIIMNLNTFRQMQKNKKIKATYSSVGTNTDNFMLLEGNLVDAIRSEFHVIPVIYDQGYNTQNIDGTATFHEYIPDNMVILLNGPIDLNYALQGNSNSTITNNGVNPYIGDMDFAPTPDELRARRGAISGDLQIFDTGVAFHTYDNPENAQTESRTVQNCLPAFTHSREVFRMSVGPKASNTNNNGPQTPPKA
jgi:hypothetical protein